MPKKIHIQYATYLADLHTPVSVYNKLRDQFPGALLFESADYHDRTDNKSFICLEPMANFQAQGLDYSYSIGTEEETNKVAQSGTEVFGPSVWKSK